MAEKKAGIIVILSSPSGAGKTTLVKKISTRKKKALEIKKVQEGTKVFGAIDPATMPQSPAGGITPPK